MPKPNRFKPTAAAREQQRQGAWSPGDQMPGRQVRNTVLTTGPTFTYTYTTSRGLNVTGRSINWPNIEVWPGPDEPEPQRRNVTAFLASEALPLVYFSQGTATAVMLAHRALKLWRNQKASVTDIDVQQQLLAAAVWFDARDGWVFDTTPMREASLRGEGLPWLDAYIALLEE